MASSSFSTTTRPLTTLPTPSQTSLINLTNVLSHALDNDLSEPSDLQILHSDAQQTDIVVRGERMSILFENPVALDALTGERPNSAHFTRPGSFHGPPNPLGSHPPSPPAMPSSRVRVVETEGEVVKVSAADQVVMSKVEIVKSITRHILRKKGKGGS
ncbi:hypothetical protein M409DRAFT_23680 [Zasmidium cellare ATCC 36951]|uniref:Uncharacterized protein n=1 Tax=Zasmidium cellare ATCC 36951 TaxID=1080233 RepID=A0A6A6CIC8_ZASCE|nr:uncharacterized protein M409DRAFT_23680 [Zasmidium cellare ATCC 36951]KAF2165950.1 hypothetical protein M409DRAFT_23680 [Zasmidium cellare ATCC 36951]